MEASQLEKSCKGTNTLTIFINETIKVSRIDGWWVMIGVKG